MKSFTRIGWWWLPHQPGTRIRGTLTFSPEEGLTLSTDLDSFGVFQFSFSILNQHHPLVLGDCDDGKQINLLDNRVTGFSMIEKFGQSRFTLIPALAIEGIHLKDGADLSFHAIRVEYSGLLWWSGLRPFESKTIDSTRKWGVQSVTEADVSVGACDTDYGELTIRTAHSSHFTLDEVNLQGVAQIEVKSVDTQPYRKWINDIVNPIQDFLVLAMNQSVSVKSIVVEYAANAPLDPTNSGRYGEVFFQPVFYGDSVNLARFLFWFKDIEDGWCHVLKSWLRLHEKYHIVMQYFFSNYYRTMYVQNRFMNVIFALEAYHRIRHQVTDGEAQDHQRRMAAINKAMSHESVELQNWVAMKLKYSYEPSLRRRLADVIKWVPQISGVMFPNSAARSHFIRRVVATRNDLAHSDGKPKDAVISGDVSFYWTTEQLSWLLKCCLLLEIGFEEGALSSIVAQHPDFKLMLQEVQ